MYKETIVLVAPLIPTMTGAGLGRVELKTGKKKKFKPSYREDEKYFRVPFRHLSAGIAGSGTWKTTYFSADVLKRAASMFDQIPAFKNHYTEVGNAIGVVADPVFQPEYRNKSGLIVPGGINADFVLNKDVDANKDIIAFMRGAEYNPYRSASVGVTFLFEPSHEFEDPDSFYWNLGEIIDDKEVTRNVTEIVSVNESSLVWAGADPTAKMLDADGELSFSDVVGRAQLAEDPLQAKYQTEKKFFISYKLQLSKSTGGFTPKERTKTDMQTKEEKIALAVAARLDLTADELSPESLKGLVFVKREEYAKKSANLAKAEVDLEKAAENLKAAKDESEKLSLKVAELEAEISENADFTEQGKALLVTEREEVIAAYQKSIGAETEPDAVIIALIEKANFAELKSLGETYGRRAYEKFGSPCENCTTGVQLRSSKAEEPAEPNRTRPGNSGIAKKFRQQ